MTRRVRVVLRWRGRPTRLGRFVSGSLAAHGLVLATIVVVPLLHRATPAVDNAMVVELAAPAAAAPPAPAAKASVATPPPPPPPKEAHTVREVPPPKPPEKEKKKASKPSPPPAPSAAPAATPAPASAAPPALPKATGTGVTPSLGGGEAVLGWYQSAVKSALESAWIKPFLENPGTTYSVTVAFDIARDGTVRNVRIVAPSGVPSLDRSAERAVLDASPLPPVPPAWRGTVLPATMRFDLTPGAS